MEFHRMTAKVGVFFNSRCLWRVGLVGLADKGRTYSSVVSGKLIISRYRTDWQLCPLYLPRPLRSVFFYKRNVIKSNLGSVDGEFQGLLWGEMTAPAQEAVMITPTKRDQKFMEPFIVIIICICFSSPARLIWRITYKHI